MQADATDAELVRAIFAGGDAAKSAEAQLCQRFGTRIRLYGLRHLRDDERARDLVQSVLVAVLEAARAGRIQAPEHTDRFILGVCRNTALRMREQAVRTRSITEQELAAMTVEAAEHVDLGALLRCYSALEARAQRVVQLSFVDEENAEAIASALAMTAGNVRVIRHRALAALRECLDAQTRHMP